MPNTISLGTYNPNIIKHNEVHNAYLATRPHASWTPTKKGKQAKLDRKAKQRGWM